MGAARAWAATALLALGTLAGAGGCSVDERAPTRLLDGSPATSPAVTLEAPMPQILTKALTIPVSNARRGTFAGRCLSGWDARPIDGQSVQRIGVAGRSLTFVERSGTTLGGCDEDTPGRAAAREPCGRAVGRLERGRLLDPRLDLAGCRTPAGQPVAFAWLDPGPGAAFVGVRQPGYVEVYPIAADLPVRLSTTSNISLRDSSASFEVSEHDARGRLLRDSRLEARVAG
jgi:hypothetical protein